MAPIIEVSLSNSWRMACEPDNNDLTAFGESIAGATSWNRQSSWTQAYRQP